jgi:RNA polymerase sigma-70 factor, ECF subfamily
MTYDPLLPEPAMVEHVYDELRRLAASFLRQERQGHTLQTSALVNEAYLRVASGRGMEFQDRQHFLRIAARAMRRILVDYGRQRSAAKRELQPMPDAALLRQLTPSTDYLALDRALTRLAEADSRQAEIVELRFFAGLSVEETAATLRISEKTVKRDWSMARAWLRGELEEPGADSRP